MVEHVEYKLEHHENGVNVNHFRCYKQGEGHAKKAMREIVDMAKSEEYEYVVVNMGRGGKKDSVGFLKHMGFEIVETEGDHVTAELEI